MLMITPYMLTLPDFMVKTLRLVAVSKYALIFVFIFVFTIFLTPSTYASIHKYGLIYNEKELAESNTLIIYSLAEDDLKSSLLLQINEFSQIISSHWRTKMTIRSFKDVTYSETKEYSHLILVEQANNPDSIKFFNLIRAFSKSPTYWLGCGIGPRNSISLMGSDIESVQYKNIKYSVDKSFTLCSSLAANDVDTVATFKTNADENFPLITKYGEHHLSAGFIIPNYYQTTDYTLPFLDSFHHFYNEHEENTHPALLRLEDVNPHTYENGVKLSKVYEILSDLKVPFHIALIPTYINPGEFIQQTLEDSPRFLFLIKEILNENGAILVQHVGSHQFGDEVTGMGYEFGSSERYKSLNLNTSHVTSGYVLKRILEAQESMRSADLPAPDIWKTPHYSKNYKEDLLINSMYPIRYEHIPNIGPLPFVAKIDDTLYIPENLGYITNEEDLDKKNQLLQQLSGFSDPVASIFWHPWRNTSELTAVIDLIQSEGYEFATAYELLSNSERVEHGAILNSASFLFTDKLVYFILIFFVLGVFIYAKNVWQLKKYIKLVKGFSITINEVNAAALQKNRDLPMIALFIPARNEGLVIANTIRRVSRLDYPKDKMMVFIIVDERELDDDVELVTKNVANETILSLFGSLDESFVKVVEVPKWYSGEYGNSEHTFAKSTKGRALNYCLQTVDTDFIEMIGILDADGRLDINVIKEVAHKRILQGSKILQGPVFQVSNFDNVNIVGKVAGLELALHHLTELPDKLTRPKSVQFLAGTNYFIDAECIKSAGGWNQLALVEDAEIALRLYTTSRIVGDWLNSPELEQTPANFTIYRKQRERWVRGHFELLPQIKNSDLSFWEKMYFYKKIFFSQFRFIFDLGLPVIAIVLMFMGAYNFLNPVFNYLSILLVVAAIFIWDTYGLTYRNIKPYVNKKHSRWNTLLLSFRLMLFIPIFMIMQAIPRFEAFVNYFFKGNKVNSWYKTERTKEVSVS